MKWQEGVAIAGKLATGDIAGAAGVPLKAKQIRKRTQAIKENKGVISYDYFSNDNDGPV